MIFIKWKSKKYMKKHCKICIFYEILNGCLFCSMCKELKYKAYKKITKKNIKNRSKYFLKFIEKYWM